MQSDLTSGSIRRHMTNIAIPSITGSLFMTLYNVVDTIWAGKIGVDLTTVHSIQEFFASSGDVRALSGIGASFPIFLVIMALSFGVMNGVMALMGNALGGGKVAEATLYLMQGFVYSIAISLLLWLILPLLPGILSLMSIQDPVVRGYTYDYIRVIIYGNIFFCISSVLGAGLTAQGDTRTQRNISILNFFLNIILDPLFLFGFGPIPAMGIQGIALATLVAQAAGTIILFLRLWQTGAFRGLSWASCKPRAHILQMIARQSLPPTLNMAIVSFLMGMVNKYAAIYGGPAAVAAYGISIRIEQIALLPGMGIGTALASIASQNNGAGKLERIREAFRIALIAGMLCLLLIMVPLGWIIPRQVVSFFTTDTETIAVSLRYLQICVLTFYSYMTVTFAGSIFQALKVPHLLTYITIGRNCILPLISFPLLSAAFGLDGIWYAILCNNGLAALTALALYLVVMRREMRREKRS